MRHPEVVDIVGSMSELDEDGLYGVLGSALLGEGMGAMPHDLSRFLRAGRAWFSENAREMKQLVCSERSESVLGVTGADDRAMLAAGIADLLVARYGGIPAAALGLLVARIGLDQFCDQ